MLCLRGRILLTSKTCHLLQHITAQRKNELANQTCDLPVHTTRKSSNRTERKRSRPKGHMLCGFIYIKQKLQTSLQQMGVVRKEVTPKGGTGWKGREKTLG